MNQNTVIKFIKTSELYLRITEQQRSAFNIEEIMPLMFSENSATDNRIEYRNNNSSG